MRGDSPSRRTSGSGRQAGSEVQPLLGLGFILDIWLFQCWISDKIVSHVSYILQDCGDISCVGAVCGIGQAFGASCDECFFDFIVVLAFAIVHMVVVVIEVLFGDDDGIIVVILVDAVIYLEIFLS